MVKERAFYSLTPVRNRGRHPAQTTRIRDRVSRLFQIAVVSFTAMFLVSCGFFGYSIYPNSLSAIDRSADLSSVLLSSDSQQIAVDAFDDGTNEFLFVVQSPGTGTAHLAILDADLHVRYFGDDSRFGRFHVLDGGAITAGGAEFLLSVDPPVLTPLPGPPAISNGQTGFYDSSTAQFMALSVASPYVTAYSYSSTWLALGSIGYTISSTYTVNDLRRTSVDQSTGIVSLIFGGDNQLFLFRFPGNSFPTLVPPLFDMQPVTVINTNGGDQVAPVPTGYVELSTDRNLQLTFHSTLAGDNSSSSLDLFHVNDPIITASPNGSYVYVLSRADKKIFRLKRWW